MSDKRPVNLSKEKQASSDEMPSEESSHIVAWYLWNDIYVLALYNIALLDLFLGMVQDLISPQF